MSDLLIPDLFCRVELEEFLDLELEDLEDIGLPDIIPEDKDNGRKAKTELKALEVSCAYHSV